MSLSTNLNRGQLHWLEHSQKVIELLLLVRKIFLSSLKMTAECIWNKWIAELNIFFVAWIEFIITMIFEITGKFTAWLMPHLVVKSSALVEVMLTAWWIVLMMGLLWMWIWAIEVAMLFLMPASEIMRVCEWFNEDMIAMSLSWLKQSSRLLSLCLIKGWNEKQLE